jgi:hypothetical protein
MIEISPDTAFLLYIGMTLLILLGTWTYHHYCSSKRKLVLMEYELSVCEYCHFAYLATRGDELTRCPQCKSLNQRNQKP